MAKLNNTREIGGGTTTGGQGGALGGGGGLLGTVRDRLTDPDRKTRMPDPSDPTQLEAMRRRISEARRKGGRVSTILSDELRSLLVGKLR